MKLANFISYFFHPINFSIVGALLYFWFVPKYIFKPQEYLLLSIIFIGSYIIPLLLIFFLKKTGMIDTYQMPTIEERKFPLLLFIAISFFLGQWLLKTNLVDILALFYFGFGICLVVIYLFLFTNHKISLHTAAIGALIGFLIFFSFHYKVNFIYLLVFFFVLSGIIASARLKLKAHNFSEILLGFSLSIVTQLGVYLWYIY